MSRRHSWPSLRPPDRSSGRVLPDLGWVRSGAFDRAVCVGAMEMVEDHRRLFSEIAGCGGPRRSSGGGDEPSRLDRTHIRSHWSIRPARSCGVGATTSHRDIWCRSSNISRSCSSTGRWASCSALLPTQGGGSIGSPNEHRVRKPLPAFPEYSGQEDIPTVLGCRWIREG